MTYLPLSNFVTRAIFTYISINDRVILPFRDFLFPQNFASAKFHENKTLTEILESTVVSLSGGLISAKSNLILK